MMRVLVWFGFVLVATAAQAQSYTTTVNRETNTVTTTGPGYSASTTQISRTATSTTYTTTITRNPGGYQPMGAGGYHPMRRAFIDQVGQSIPSSLQGLTRQSTIHPPGKTSCRNSLLKPASRP